jgi:hypothetical protein
MERRCMTLFDVYLAVDWSARSLPGPMSPSADAVWVGERILDTTLGISVSSEDYFRTRWDGVNHLRARLRDHRDAGRRVMLGFDFAYGYPSGFAEALGLRGDGPPWRRVWNELTHRIDDRANNGNNRFVVAGELNNCCDGLAVGSYWGHPANLKIDGLRPTSPPFPFPLASGRVLVAKRETELCLPRTQSAWKLWTAGNVGSQTLLGIPALARLRDDPEFAEISRVWPFETGFGLPPMPLGAPVILHAEIWPGVVNDLLDPALPIRDQGQVRAMVGWLAQLDAAGTLLSHFGPPAALSPMDREKVLEQEGWILGAGSAGGVP